MILRFSCSKKKEKAKRTFPCTALEKNMWYAKILYPKKNRWNRETTKKTLQGRKNTKTTENHLEQSFLVSRVTRERGSGLYPIRKGVERFQDLHFILRSWKVSCLFAYFLQALPKFIEEMITICLWSHFWGRKSFLQTFAEFRPSKQKLSRQKKSLGNLGRGRRKGKKNGKPWKHLKKNINNKKLS